MCCPIASRWSSCRNWSAGESTACGCPFAPRATGNIATEDLVYMLHRSGVDTGVDLDAAIRAAEWLEAQLGHGVPGQVMKAGGFPAPRAA